MTQDSWLTMSLTVTSMPRKSSKSAWYSRMLSSGPMNGPGSGQISSGVITLSCAISGRRRSQSPVVEALERLVDEVDVPPEHMPQG